MSRRLQQTGFDRSSYERPNQDWVCGHTGKPCALGPDARGECHTTHECVPAREGDRWRCARSSPFGGPCEQGPLPDGTCCNAVAPCQPQRSIRARRGRTVRIAVAITLGVLGVALGGSGALDFVAPGPVTRHHGTIDQECARCHAAGEGGLAHWIGMAIAREDRVSDSERCLACHDLGPQSTLPHSVPAPRLAAATERLADQAGESDAPLRLTLASLGPARSVRAGAELPCAVCHQEHGGSEAELTRLSNDQCQVCHTLQFDRFERDHPPLGDYPYGRRTRIRFDHAMHIEELFDGDIDCVTCHAPEATGRTMDVNPFAVSCAGSCHDHVDHVRSVGPSGIPFLNLPDIDASGLRRSGVDPGQWPAITRPRNPSPFIHFLLAADERLPARDRATVASLGRDLRNAASQAHDQREAVGRWVWSYKRLLLELKRDGQPAVASRVLSPALLDGNLGEAERANLTRGLDHALVGNAIDDWFPDLAREVAIFDRITRDLDDLSLMTRSHWRSLQEGLRDLARQRSGSRRPSAGSEKGMADWVRDGGWYRNGSDASIRYRSTGHADAFLRTWFDVAGAFPNPDASSIDTAETARGLFDGLRSENTTGSCTLCHSIDEDIASVGEPVASLAVAWEPYRPDPSERRATEFRHLPHFSLDQGGRCDSCHRIREDSSEAFELAYAEGAQAHGHTLNFDPIALETCGSCHTREGAGDDCVACHNYHLGQTAPVHVTVARRPSLPMPGAPEAAGESEIEQTSDEESPAEDS